MRAIGALPAFCSVTASGADKFPIDTRPKSRLPGDAVTSSAADPVPVNGTKIWPPGMFAWIVSCALRSPPSSGENRTRMVHFDPALTGVAVQSSVSLKGAAVVMDVTTRAIPPVFLIVRLCEGLVLPMACDEKSMEAGSTEAVVHCAPAVNRGTCQIPLPYVAAMSTSGEAEGGAALNFVTGA